MGLQPCIASPEPQNLELQHIEGSVWRLSDVSSAAHRKLASGVVSAHDCRTVLGQVQGETAERRARVTQQPPPSPFGDCLTHHVTSAS